MKQMKIVLAAILAVFMGTTFTSCLDSDSSAITYVDYVTGPGYSASTLSSDRFSGVTYSPSNPGVLKYSSTESYATRALIYYELPEGQEFVDGKTNYTITITGAVDLVGDPFSLLPDTITNFPGVSFSSIDDYWAVNNYLTIFFKGAYLSNYNPKTFNMYPERVDGSNLYVRLVHNQDIANPSDYTTYAVSFNLPSKYDLEDYFDGELEYLTNDSVDIIVRAKSSDTQFIESKPIRARIRY